MTGAEPAADAGRAMTLGRIQADQNDDRQLHDVRLQRWGCDLKALDRRQDRNRRHDYAVAV